MKRFIVCLILLVAGVFLTGNQQVEARGCSAEITCGCKCYDNGKEFLMEHGTVTVHVNGSCENPTQIGPCGRCTTNIHQQKHGAELCCKRYGSKCKSTCNNRAYEKVLGQDEHGNIVRIFSHCTFNYLGD
ncbi:MAG: hypothetical protein HOJ48_08245 [Desulfobacula sp.]|jgi:hypothetical protein|nr:hypothetical protein [Desulfobacula sp.]